jgi:pimeloyl-ACP methyl ester carboxylesterase
MRQPQSLRVERSPIGMSSLTGPQPQKENIMLNEIVNFALRNSIGLAAVLVPAVPLLAQTPAPVVKNIVLVHGAFADGTSCSKIIPILEGECYHVVSVQNPLTSLADDVAATRRAIALQDGPVILVGHSWGGAVITQAGDDPKVAGLVYVAAYAPNAGESANQASTPFGITEGQKAIRVDSEKFAYMTPDGILNHFAQGLPMEERRVVLAVQGESYGPMFDEKLTVAAWQTRPSWVVIAANDQMLPPAMEAASAKRLGATATTLSTCHLAMLEQPVNVAAVIDQAAKTALRK